MSIDIGHKEGYLGRNAENNLNLRTLERDIRFVEFIYRYRYHWLLAAILSVVVAGVLLIYLPRKYASEAKFIVKVGRESIGLDPTVTTSETLLMQKTQEEEINSTLEVIYSRTIKEAVINELGVDTILSGKMADESGESTEQTSSLLDPITNSISDAGNFLLEIGVRDPVSDFERAVIKLEDTTYCYATKKSQVISVYNEAESPELAQKIVQLMIKFYLEEHLKISQTTGSYEFFKSEFEQSKSLLDKAKMEMMEFMSANQVVSVDSNQALLRESWNSILASVLQLEQEEATLASSYSEFHPLREAAIKRLARARKALLVLKVKTGAAIPEQIDKVIQKIGSDEAIANLSPDDKTLTMIQRIDGLVRSNNKLEIMEENLLALEDRLGNHRRKFEESRSIRVQQENSISNISLFQPATFNEKPIAPNKILVVAATGLLIFGTLFALGLWREARRLAGGFHKVSDVERILKIPVVSKVPVDRTISETANEELTLENLRSKCHGAVHAIMQNKKTKLHGENLAAVAGVLSVEKGNGGSTYANALAACCSQDFGLKTLLVDIDPRMRSASKQFSLNGSPGLNELLSEDAELSACVQRFEPLGLSIVASTNKDAEEAKKISFAASDVLEQLDRLSKGFEVVIVDLPPASEASSSVFLAPQLEIVLLVAQAGKTTSESAFHVLQKFETSNTRIHGVLNKYRREFPWEKAS